MIHKVRLIAVTRAMYCLDYPSSVRWQHLFSPSLRLECICFSNVATRAALPQNRVQTLIGSQANYEIKLN